MSVLEHNGCGRDGGRSAEYGPTVQDEYETAKISYLFITFSFVIQNHRDKFCGVISIGFARGT